MGVKVEKRKPNVWDSNKKCNLLSCGSTRLMCPLAVFKEVVVWSEISWELMPCGE